MFTMKLDQKYYNYILNGTKDYENKNIACFS